LNTLNGLSAFTLTPYSDNGIVDVEHLQRLVARLAASAVDSIGVLGSTGSYMYLNRAQRARAIAAAVEASGDTPVLAGVGDLRTDYVVEHAVNAEKSGAAALLLAPVSYLPLTDHDFTELVKTVVSNSAVPVCLYNNPGTTKFTMSAALVAALAHIPSVAAVKNPAPSSMLTTSELAQTRSALPEGFVMGYSGDARIANVLPAGADAWYSVIAGTLPQLALEIWSARNDPAKLHELNTLCTPLWECFDRWGGIRVVPEIARIIGLGLLPLALPLQPLDDSAVAAIQNAVEPLMAN